MKQLVIVSIVTTIALLAIVNPIMLQSPVFAIHQVRNGISANGANGISANGQNCIGSSTCIGGNGGIGTAGQAGGVGTNGGTNVN